jgi:5-formyltetrahydrofolate cyclo-ligase
VITGVGFSEIVLVLVLVLLFFGSKELPTFVREAGKMVSKVRKYGDQVRRELDVVAREVSPVAETGTIGSEARETKNALRNKYLAARKALSDEQRETLSSRIAALVLALPEVRSAKAVMVYRHTRTEVRTGELIAKLRAEGKRIVLPYTRTVSRDLGVAEVTDEHTQTAPGAGGIHEPVPGIRDNFLKSDIGVVICPGVGFDRLGGRLGRGQGYYDNFLREINGRVPFVGLAFGCQVAEEPFPFDYHDVPMTLVVTEDGVYKRTGDRPVDSPSPAG